MRCFVYQPSCVISQQLILGFIFLLNFPISPPPPPVNVNEDAGEDLIGKYLATRTVKKKTNSPMKGKKRGAYAVGAVEE